MKSRKPFASSPRRVSLVVIACLALSACLYRLDIQQGNVVTPEMVEQLQLGMDKRQVRFLLGTPLVADAFHQNRWDYVYSYQPGGGKREQQRVSLFFRDDRLEVIDAELDPKMDLHTVVEARDTVITVPPRKRGFFAALTGGAAPDEAVRVGPVDESPVDPNASASSMESLQDVQPEMMEGSSNIGRDLERDVEDVTGSGGAHEPVPPADAPPDSEAGSSAAAISPSEVYDANVAGTATPPDGAAPPAAAPEEQKDELGELFRGFGTGTGPPPLVRD